MQEQGRNATGTGPSSRGGGQGRARVCACARRGMLGGDKAAIGVGQGGQRLEVPLGWGGGAVQRPTQAAPNGQWASALASDPPSATRSATDGWEGGRGSCARPCTSTPAP